MDIDDRAERKARRRERTRGSTTLMSAERFGQSCLACAVAEYRAASAHSACSEALLFAPTAQRGPRVLQVLVPMVWPEPRQQLDDPVCGAVGPRLGDQRRASRGPHLLAERGGNLRPQL